MSRIRNKAYNTVHHLTSRIAHQAFFLKEDERNDFLSIARRVSAFSGVELFGWCIMHNHFHLYVYLPTPPTLSDEEILARFYRLKGAEFSSRVSQSWQNGSDLLCQLSPDRAEARDELVKSIRRRMYSIAEYARMVKQWFTEEYNGRNGHKGTLWAAPYGDHPIFLPESSSDYGDMRDILAYIHLNPIRAAITDRYDGYRWSSYTAFRNGESDAVSAMHRIYPGMTDSAIVDEHEARMARLLEDWKRRRAEAIARKRLDGFEMPADALTDECMIAQAVAHADDIQKELEQLHAERDIAEGAKARRELIMKQIRAVLIVHPEFKAGEVASVIDVPMRTVYRYMKDIRMDSAA